MTRLLWLRRLCWGVAVIGVCAAPSAWGQVDGGAPPDGAAAPVGPDAGVAPAAVVDLGATAVDGGATPVQAAAPARKRLVAPVIDVIGRAPRVVESAAGTSAVVRKEDIKQLAAQSGADALRMVSGAHVVSEDGIGLRQNIGFRGLDPNRSRKVLVLEDGVPVTLNPYGVPELYYAPPIERMDRVEVVKGSGQLLAGPQTVGGQVNYITRDPPKKLGGMLDIRYGSFNYVVGQAAVGATHGPIGWRLDVLHRRFEGPRALNLEMTDVSGKIKLQLAPSSVLTLKLDYYIEGSNATYLGPTTPQLAVDPTFNPLKDDKMDLQRWSALAIHRHLFNSRLMLQTSAYAYQTGRVWRRQDYDRQDLGKPYAFICDASARCGAPGDAGIRPTSDGGTTFFRETTSLRDRLYHVAGVEPRLTWSWSGPKVVTGELVALIRFNYERAREKVVSGSTPTAWSGEILDDELRNGYALAAALQHKFTLWDRFHVTPALRFESFWTDRNVLRQRQAAMDGTTKGQDVDVKGGAFNWQLMPGLGLAVDAATPVTIYAGFHRGYAPPRSRDAVSTSGQNLQLDPESSWNTELGVRLKLERWLFADVAAFWIEFDNQIIPPGETGQEVIGSDFNTGQSRNVGVEATATFDIAGVLKRADFSLPLSVNYTYVPLAEFVGGLRAGNRLPYAPEQMVYAQLRFNHRTGPSAQIGLSYVGEQFADKENTVTPSPDGLVGVIPAYLLLDARIAYTNARTGLTVYLAGKNLTNQIYIASRAPQGAQPAGFRQFFGGIEWSWF